jgi:hypothetical protein
MYYLINVQDGVAPPCMVYLMPQFNLPHRTSQNRYSMNPEPTNHNLYPNLVSKFPALMKHRWTLLIGLCTQAFDGGCMRCGSARNASSCNACHQVFVIG